MPVVAFHGTADKIVPYEGDQRGILPPVRQWASGWAGYNGCDRGSREFLRQEGVVGEVWGGCEAGADVVLYTIEGGGHNWPGGSEIPGLEVATQAIDATEVIWAFFAAHSLFPRGRCLLTQLDPYDWDPLAVDDVVPVFRSIGVRWWIAGGWALDLHLGRQTRPHEDLDVGILYRDHLVVQRHLGRDWQLFKTKQPGLAPWPVGEPLPPKIDDVWIRRDDEAPWAFQLVIAQSEGDQWVYDRLPAIRRPLEAICLHTAAGVPYLRPEIQLLYKGGSSARRPKDLADLQRFLPALAPDEVRWLREALGRQFPGGHEWLPYIDRYVGEGRNRSPG